jgi:GntR family transcriptional regulator / MocR family aminotransferase
MHQLAISLVDGDVPVFRQIADAIQRDVERGRFAPGDRLPSTRILAHQLRVHRKTIAAAFAELEAQGWIECVPRWGVRIAATLPERLDARHRSKAAMRPGFDHLRAPVPPRPASRRARFDLLGGVPAFGSAPTAELARAFRRSLARDRGHHLVDYGDARGHERLRVALAAWLARTRGLGAKSDAIHVVRGAQNGLYLTARALLVPGDRVAVEEYTHPVISSLFRLLHVEMVPIPIDDEGMCVDALEAIAETNAIRAVYTTPHHQLPTTVTLSHERRRRLLTLASRRRWIIFEDDYDHEFQYAGDPVLPLAYMDRHGVVVYLGTLSKVVAPGLRIGFVAATPPVVDRIARYRTYVDVQGDQILENAVAHLLEDGEIERHIRRMLRIYRHRRDALCAALSAELPMLQVAPPRGGMAGRSARSRWASRFSPRATSRVATSRSISLASGSRHATRRSSLKPSAF